MNKVLMKIVAHQQSRDGEEDVMELLTEGKHYNKNGVIYLIYEESELCGITGCVTTLKIAGDVVKLRRYGVQNQEMNFEKGKSFMGIYETPMGDFDMEIITNNVENSLVRGGISGTLVIDYDVSIKGLAESHNILDIKIALVKK